MVFPEGIVGGSAKRTCLTSNENILFFVKSLFMRSSGNIKEKLPIKNEEESSLIDKTYEISNQSLIRDMEIIIDLEEVLNNIK